LSRKTLAVFLLSLSNVSSLNTSSFIASISYLYALQLFSYTSLCQKQKTVTISRRLALVREPQRYQHSRTAIDVSSMVILWSFIQDKSMMAATKRSPIHKNVARFRSGTGRWLFVCLWFSLSL
jgi:hypothetical protein